MTHDLYPEDGYFSKGSDGAKLGRNRESREGRCEGFGEAAEFSA